MFSSIEQVALLLLIVIVIVGITNAIDKWLNNKNEEQ